MSPYASDVLFDNYSIIPNNGQAKSLEEKLFKTYHNTISSK